MFVYYRRLNASRSLLYVVLYICVLEISHCC